MTRLPLIITGGQTGADQAAWRAAASSGLSTGGFMPRGFLDENGPQYELGALYHATELPSTRFEDRTIANIRAADATLVFRSSRCSGSGTELTVREAEAAGNEPPLIVDVDTLNAQALERVVEWLRSGQFSSLNVAGDRESVDSGVGVRIERFLLAVFERLGKNSGE